MQRAYHFDHFREVLVQIIDHERVAIVMGTATEMGRVYL